MSEAQATVAGSTKRALSREELEHVASLANLELTDYELRNLGGDLQNTLRYIDQLDELNTADVPPMEQVGDILAEGAGQQQAHGGQTLRADAVKPSVDRSLVMAEAPETDGRFFKVPKVIER